MNRERLEEWLLEYRRAWEDGDAEAAARLFTPTARYHRTPFETLEGQEEIATYWSQATGNQTDVAVTTEAISTEGDIGIGRFVAEYTDGSGTDVTLDGVCFVELDEEDQRCRTFREWWHRAPIKRE